MMGTRNLHLRQQVHVHRPRWCAITAAEPERIRVYSLPGWRDLLAGAKLKMTHALADTNLPLVTCDRDHCENLVIVGRK